MVVIFTAVGMHEKLMIFLLSSLVAQKLLTLQQ